MIKNSKITKKNIKYIFLSLLILVILITTLGIVYLVKNDGSISENNEYFNFTNSEVITATEVEKIKENDLEVKKISVINDIFFDILNTNLKIEENDIVKVNKENSIKNITISNFKLINKDESKVKVLAPNEEKTILFNNNSENLINSQIKFSTNLNEEKTKIAFRIFEFGYKTVNSTDEIKLLESDVNDNFEYKIAFDVKVKLDNNKEYITNLELEINNKQIANNEKVEKKVDLSKYVFKVF